jgi:hypothetical protein
VREVSLINLSDQLRAFRSEVVKIRASLYSEAGHNYSDVVWAFLPSIPNEGVAIKREVRV